MRTSLIFLFLLNSLLCIPNLVSQEINHDTETCGHQSHNKVITIVSEGKTNVNTIDYDLTYVRLELDIDPAVYKIQGVVTSYFKVLAQQMNEIYFDLSTALVVSSVKYHGQSIGFEQIDPFALKISLPTLLNLGTCDSLSITYSGEPVGSGFGSFIKSSQGETPIIWTLSEPYGARDWWPCKNGLDDKIDSLDVIISSPSKYSPVSNGILSHEEITGSQKKSFWKTRYPITPYLVAFAVTEYSIYQDDALLSNGKILPVINYVYSVDEQIAKAGTAENVKTLQFFDSLFVDYPFKNEKYGHVQFGWGGGMEHQTGSYVVNFSWSLLAHELAHQWFGDYVTCGSWEDIWLNEGFATYLEGITYERFPEKGSWFDWKKNRRDRIISIPDGSVRVNDTTSVSRIFNSRLSYSKGAYLLNMLRWKLGDEYFFTAIRSYLNKKAHSFARTTELKAEFENVSGQNLTEFFDDWFIGEGYPIYTITWYAKDDKIGIRVHQTTSHPSVDFFEMPLPLLLKGTKDTLIRIENTENDQFFLIDDPNQVNSIIFNPYLQILTPDTATINITGSSVHQAHESNLISCYPNPAKDYLNINFSRLKIRYPLGYTIYDTKGSLVLSGKLGENEAIPIKGLASGTYYIKIKDKKSMEYITKFVVLK